MIPAAIALRLRPCLPGLQCLSELRLLAAVRQGELALAGRIEAELEGAAAPREATR